MFFHKNVTYGIKVILYLSRLDNNIRTAKEISSELQIPKEFTSKVLQSLTNSGIIISKKGKGGGFCLGKKPSDIKLIDVIVELDKSTELNICLFGIKECKLKCKCPMHDSLNRVRYEFYDIINNHTVKELLISGWFRF
ncbi:MAG: Rrf2 family transcriptional regulator [Melioribacteraceae bacterium]|nr:Rrf2 family transcriptional regulator [Melioribacteraceae bacterium]MDD3558703.1 Rrf2 family transcriptional regulator [Melioribacteraceae bacterium]